MEQVRYRDIILRTKHNISAMEYAKELHLLKTEFQCDRYTRGLCFVKNSLCRQMYFEMS